jgi:hypothetical protein
MGLNVKVKKVGNHLQKLAQQFHKIDGESVEVGHFKSQGKHSSGYTYAELMLIHHNGGNPTGTNYLPPRPVLDLLFFNNQNLGDPKFKSVFTAWSRRTLSKGSNAILLQDIGAVLRDKEKAIFGSAALAPNAVPPKSRNSPLVATGDLRSKVAYKTSIGNKVKEE